MTEEWDELKRLFHDICGRPRPEWPALVSAVVARDRTLGDKLAALLHAHEADGSFLESSPLALLESVEPSLPRLVSGTRLGPYQIVTFIGAGGMGEVYRARDERLGRDVAIKILPADLARDTNRHRRMELEARAVGMLNHPNILTVYDVGLYDGSPFIVSELLEGETLRTSLERSRTEGRMGLPTEEAWRVVRAMAEGLAAAHGRGVVHRDLKPDNVFVTTDGRVKILDFGLAKLTAPEDSEGPTQTMAGTILGTVGYMAPEQVRGQAAGPPADIFASGAIFYELLSGSRPFEGVNAADTMAAILTADPVPLRSRRPDVPAAAVSIIERCLAKNPDARYQSGMELVAVVPAGFTSIGGQSALGRWWPRRTWVGVSAGGVAIAAILSLAGWWMAGRHDRSASQRVDLDAARRVVAVLPFKNVSADPAQDYFSAGVTEEIRGQLSRVSDLRLLSRSATDRYSKGDGRQRMAEELGAGSVVEGSVRLEKQRVRIAVQLIDARNEQSIWAEQYDRQLNDIFAVQGEVALQIADALRATLSGDERRRVSKPLTENVMAYELYLKALTLSAFQREPNRESIGLLRQALALDPRFAAARARIAYRTLFLSTYDDPANLKIALEMALQAVATDSTLDDGHSALAAIYSAQGDVANARLSFLRAMELNPSHFEAMTNLSSLEQELGRLDESLLWARRGFQLVPNASIAYFHVGLPLIYLDRASSEQWLSYAAQRFPNAGRIKTLQAMLEYQKGKAQDAENRARKAVEADPRNEELQILLAELTYLTGASDAESYAERFFLASPDMTGTWWITAQSPRTRYGYLLTKRGDALRGEKLLNDSLRLATKAMAEGNQSPRARLEMAAIHAARQENELAVTWLQRAYDAGWRFFRVLGTDPGFASIRNEPRFEAILQRMERDVVDMTRRVNIRETLPIPPPLAK